MIDFIRRALALKRKVDAKMPVVDEGLSAWDHAVQAYERGASLPGILRVATGTTSSTSDDKLDDAALALLGEAKQALFNGAQVLRANAALFNGLADQMDGVYDALQRAESAPLKEVLEP